MLLELDFLEAVQIEAALQARLVQATVGQTITAEGSVERAMVDHELVYTAKALTNLQELLYGTDEPDEDVAFRWVMAQP